MTTKRKLKLSEARVQYASKRISKHFGPGRAVVYKPDGRVAKIIKSINVGIHEMWLVDFGNKEELAVFESNIVPYDDRLCFCQFPLSNKHADCSRCRWYICPNCNRCGCSRHA